MVNVRYRNIFLFILLSIVTLGIYPLVAYCIMGEEVNDICRGDGDNNMFYLLAALLGIVTLGIYPIVWYCKAMNRLCNNGYRYGITVRHTGTEFLLWYLFGILLFGVGPIVALCLFVSDLNQFANLQTAYGNNYVQDNQGYYLQNGEQQYYGEQQQYYGEQQQYYGEQQQYYGEQQQYYGNGGENPADYGETDTLSSAPTSAPTSEPAPSEGSVMWLGGEYTGYTFPIKPDTEVIIGKDPNQSNIVIGKEHATVSRKHVGIRYDSSNGMYILTDYSTNGTYINDGAYTGRLERGAATYIGSGVIASIGNGENSFKLV